MSKVELVNGKVLTKCCICGGEFTGWGNNPEPVTALNDEQECCDNCNSTVVIPARMKEMGL